MLIKVSCYSVKAENWFYRTFLQPDEIKLEIEQTTMKFIDLARQMETFFLQKRFLLSSSKPELLLKEENVDLRQEITRKDDLIKKHLQKIGKWKEYLADVAAVPARQPMQQGGHIPNPGAIPPVRNESPPPLLGAYRHGPQAMMQQPQMMQPNPQSTIPMGPQGMVPRANFNPQGPMGGNPLAFLEKTTNNIDMGPAPR
jgi:mediator of RNA polymerase II transcription subunit 28